MHMTVHPLYSYMHCVLNWVNRSYMALWFRSCSSISFCLWLTGIFCTLVPLSSFQLLMCRSTKLPLECRWDPCLDSSFRYSARWTVYKGRNVTFEYCHCTDVRNVTLERLHVPQWLLQYCHSLCLYVMLLNLVEHLF